jgi:hypothetical protein
MKYTVITTFNHQGYKQYGQRMIQSWLRTWPQEIKLVVYAEDCTIEESAPNLVVRDISIVQSLTKFKTKWQGVPKANGNVSNDPIRSQRRDSGKGFKWDAVRFAHKVYSIFHCAENTTADMLIWMDGDTYCHSTISMPDIQKLCPSQHDLCFLGRRGKFSECGLYAVNLASDSGKLFLTKFKQYYDEDIIFNLDEWHDSFVFDAVRNTLQLNELDWSSHLVTGEGHPLINSDWGRYLDHLKGKRKDVGRSPLTDLKVHRTEEYWQ